MRHVTRFFLLLLLCAPSTAFAWKFTLSGKVTEFDSRAQKNICLDSAVILLYKNGTLVQHIAKKDSCKFRFSLDRDADYLLACGKPGYITKWFSIDAKNAHAPSEENWDLELDLFRTYPGIDYSVFENPVAIIRYSAAIKMFDYDKEYTMSVITRVNKAKQETEAARKDAMLRSCDLFYPTLLLADSAYAKGEWENAYKFYRSAKALHPYEPGIDTRVAEAKNKIDSVSRNCSNKHYLDLVRRADAWFVDKSWATAKINYQEALALMPYEQYPKDQIARCDAFLAEEAKRNEENYKTFIAQADKAFSGKLYTRAKVLYKDASALKPGEQYPKDQMKTCDGLIAKEADKEEKYRNLIAGADGNFMLGEWKEARLLYLEAMCYKPNDQYARHQVRGCNAKLPD